jgi:hypothetical protein
MSSPSLGVGTTKRPDSPGCKTYTADVLTTNAMVPMPITRCTGDSMAVVKDMNLGLMDTGRSVS